MPVPVLWPHYHLNQSQFLSVYCLGLVVFALPAQHRC
jgi:hypothetical protein